MAAKKLCHFKRGMITAGSAATTLLRLDADSDEAFTTIEISVPQLRALAFDRNDDLYAVRFHNGDWYRIELGTGAATLIGSTGRHNVTWDAKDERGLLVTSGVYVYVLEAGAITAQRKPVLMK